MCFFYLSDSRSEKSTVISSLDCLSSIVERITTDTSPSPTVQEGSEGSPCSPQEGSVLTEPVAPVPSPTSCIPASHDPNTIYQVL